jgi:hypothetical protein
MTNELCNQPLKMILITVKKGTRAWGYFDALVSLHKDLSIRDHPGYIVQL